MKKSLWAHKSVLYKSVWTPSALEELALQAHSGTVESEYCREAKFATPKGVSLARGLF